MDPNEITAQLTAALTLHRAGQLTDAETAYRQALALDPQNPSALHLLGVVMHQKGDSAAAADLIRRAIAIYPHLPAMYNNLGEALRNLDQTDEAAEAYRAALKLKPAYPEALNNLAGAMGSQNRLDEAIEYLRQAIAVSPDYADAHWNLAVAYFLKNDWPNALAEFEWRLKRPENRDRPYPQPRWRGEPLAGGATGGGRTLLLWAEQGFGDVIQFFRFVPLAKRSGAGGARVIVDVHPELVSLLRSQGLADQVIAAGESVAFDVQAPLLSVPFILGITASTLPRNVPYLTAPPDRVASWSSAVPKDGTLKVGVVWAGRPQHANDRRRSCPPELFKPLAKIPGVTFVNLQKRHEGTGAGTRLPPLPLLDAGASLTDFALTAGLIAHLDLVISVDTAVAHLAGAMGKPVWLLLPFSPDWRWLLDRPDSPWYPTMRIFRQPTFGDWPPVLAQVAEQLRLLVSRT